MQHEVPGFRCYLSCQRSAQFCAHVHATREPSLGAAARSYYSDYEYYYCSPHLCVGFLLLGLSRSFSSSSSPPPLLLLCHPHGNPRHTRHSSSWALTPHTVTHSHHTLHTHYWHFIPHILCGVLTLGSRSFSFSSSSSSAPPPPRTSVRPSHPS